MGGSMWEKSDVLSNNLFLDELYFLRQQKGKYLCADFCTQLENISHKINEELCRSFNFKLQASVHSQLPEKVSNDFIELCLECIENDIHQILSFKHSPQALPKTQISQMLINISNDLGYLANHIKFTLNCTNLVPLYL